MDARCPAAAWRKTETDEPLTDAEVASIRDWLIAWISAPHWDDNPEREMVRAMRHEAPRLRTKDDIVRFRSGMELITDPIL